MNNTSNQGKLPPYMLVFIFTLVIPFGGAVFLFTRPWGLIETFGILLALVFVFPIIIGLKKNQRA